MASVEHPGLVSFLSMRMPSSVPGKHGTTANLLAILGWLQVALISVTILMWGFILLGSLLMGAVIGMAEGTGPFAGVGSAMLLLPVIVGLGFLVLYWNSWIYAKWIGRDPRARRHMVFMATLTILAILTLPLRDPLSMLFVLAKAALAIWLLITIQGTSAKAWLETEATMHVGWRPVLDA